jgi:hypothetical protein
MMVKIHKTIILQVVSYGCETVSLASREEQRLWMFENSVLRRIFGPNTNEVVKEFKKLHNKSFIICIHPQISLGR